MSSEKLKSDIICTRDQRQELLGRHLRAGHPATIVLSLNIPGALKSPPGIDGLFSWALDAVAEAVPDLSTHETSTDLLGPFAVMTSTQDADMAKHRCIAIEQSQPSARLLDLDVYDHLGRQVDRTALSLPPRPCLVCESAAMECIRLSRHTYEDLTDKVYELLAPYRN